jgi:starch synthase
VNNNENPMRVLHVCTEIYPLLKTGGLADVAAALPPALVRAGCDARMLVPAFPALLDGLRDRETVTTLPGRFGAAELTLYSGLLPNGVKAYAIGAPELYDRPGNPYADSASQPYPDNHRRFALLGWLAARLTEGLDPSWTPQILHCHDWHAGLAPAYLRAAQLTTGRKSAGSVFTVHNLAYQGLFGSQAMAELGLPAEFFGVYGLEFHGQLSFLKSGLFYSDLITTVSPTYAREIQGAEQGCGLEGLLSSRAHELHGILNGVDTAVWNPATDDAIAARYDSAALDGKRACKRALQEETGLAVQDGALLFGIVSRLTHQKGLDLALAGLHEILDRGGQLVLLGSGDPELETAFRQVASARPESVSVQIGFDEGKAHRIVAGCDIIMVPSLFEPCGLTQLYGLRYGTLPLVRHVGGLADTVTDCSLENLADGSATGFVFDRFDADAFSAAVRRAFALYARPADWLDVQRRGMREELGWDAAAGKMMPLYRRIAG